MKSALFVDFDNVFSGRRRLDSSVAKRFAMQPMGWIRWLTDSLPAPLHAAEGASRRLLVRRCYLNPQVSPTELNAILGNLIADLAEHPYQLSDTSKRVRDRCRDCGHATSREEDRKSVV